MSLSKLKRPIHMPRKKSCRSAKKNGEPCDYLPEGSGRYCDLHDPATLPIIFTRDVYDIRLVFDTSRMPSYITQDRTYRQGMFYTLHPDMAAPYIADASAIVIDEDDFEECKQAFIDELGQTLIAIEKRIYDDVRRALREHDEETFREWTQSSRVKRRIRQLTRTHQFTPEERKLINAVLRGQRPIRRIARLES